MSRIVLTALVLATTVYGALAMAASPRAGDLTPIGPSDWNRARAAHLL